MEYQIAGALYRIIKEMKDGDLREAPDGAVECNWETFQAIKKANSGRDTAMPPVLTFDRNESGEFEIGKGEEARGGIEDQC